MFFDFVIGCVKIGVDIVVVLFKGFGILDSMKVVIMGVVKGVDLFGKFFEIMVLEEVIKDVDIIVIDIWIFMG